MCLGDCCRSNILMGRRQGRLVLTRSSTKPVRWFFARAVCVISIHLYQCLSCRRPRIDGLPSLSHCLGSGPKAWSPRACEFRGGCLHLAVYTISKFPGDASSYPSLGSLHVPATCNRKQSLESERYALDKFGPNPCQVLLERRGICLPCCRNRCRRS